MKLLAKIGLRLTTLISFLFIVLLPAAAQTANNDIAGGSSVFVFVKAEKSPAFRNANVQQKSGKIKRRAVVLGKKNASETVKSSVRKPADVIEPIASEEWINENADYAVEERKVADDEPLLFLSEGFLNSRIRGCSAPVFPVAARKAKLKNVRLKVLVTIAKYGGVLDATVLEGDAIFRHSVYKSLGEGMAFDKSYFMGEPVRIQGVLEFTQHNSDSYNMISCRDAVKEAELPAVIEGGILNDKATDCESPQFPADAKAANLKLVEAKVQVVVDETGKVVSAKPIDGGHPAFSQTAAQAALKATFRKSIIMNKPVKVSGTMIFTQNQNNDVLCKNTTE